MQNITDGHGDSSIPPDLVTGGIKNLKFFLA